MKNPAMGATEWSLLVILSILWGGSFFFVEVVLTGLGPLTVVLGRVGIAAAALTAFVLVSGDRMPAEARLWGALFVMGVLNNLIPFCLIVWGQVYLESGLASILNATTPLFTVVLAHFLTADERMTWNRMAGIAVGFIGVVILIGPEALRGLTHQGLGQVAILGAAVSYAAAGIYGRRLKNISPTVASAGMLVSATAMMVPVVLVFETPMDMTPGATALGALLGLGLLSTAVAYPLYFRVLATAGATNLLLVTFLIPVSALLLGTLILGEEPAWNAFAGMAFIFLGLATIDGRLVQAVRARD